MVHPHTLSQLVFCFSGGGRQPPGISSIIHELHTCTTCRNPSAEKAGGSRQTYSSTSRQSSPRSRSSCYTSGQHKPRFWGCCSRKPGTLGGCGASHLQGQTHRTRLTPPDRHTGCDRDGTHQRLLPGHFPCSIK